MDNRRYVRTWVTHSVPASKALICHLLEKRKRSFWTVLLVILLHKFCPLCTQDAQSLHGDIPQKQREVTLKGFRNGSFGVLVATNVAARGLDIPEVDLVIQSSPPKVSYLFGVAGRELD